MDNLHVILKGLRNFKDGLWDIQLPMASTPNRHHNSTVTHKLNVLVPKCQTKTELAQFYHAAICSPVLRTLQQAIHNDHFLSWPGIDKINFEKYITDTLAIDKGHLDHERKNLRSTTTVQSPDFQDLFPASKDTSIPEKTFTLFSSIVPFTAKAMTYGDIAGAFPYTSSRGSKYIYVMYDYDANAILTYPLKSRQAHEIIKAWSTLHAQMTRHGHLVKKLILDNECSNDLKKALNKKNIAFQLVPPDAHRRNAAERAIRTFKNHFLSTLVTCHVDFPIAEWDWLLPQSQMTLNLLRAARCNPNLSAYAYLAGPHNFNKVPLAPPGTKIFVHTKPHKRQSWAYHGQVGWYVGPAIHHYRCFRVYMPQTGREIITDTLKFLPEKIPFPTEPIQNKLHRAITKIINILNTTEHPQLLPMLRNKSDIRHAFSHIQKILQQQLPPSNPTVLSYQQLPVKKYSAPEPRVQKATFKPPVKLPHDNPPIPILPPMPKNLLSSPNFQSSKKENKLPKLRINHIFDQAGKKRSIDSLLQDKTTHPVWSKALENELGRLAQGFDNCVKAQDAMDFIYHREIPAQQKVTYANFVCDLRPLKSEKFRVRMTVGGDKLDYFDNTSSPTASLIETKLLINSVISDHKSKNAKFCSMDLKVFF